MPAGVKLSAAVRGVGPGARPRLTTWAAVARAVSACGEAPLLLPQSRILRAASSARPGRGSRLPMCDQAGPSSSQRLGPSRSLSETDASHGRSVGAARSAFCRYQGRSTRWCCLSSAAFSGCSTATASEKRGGGQAPTRGRLGSHAKRSAADAQPVTALGVSSRRGVLLAGELVVERGDCWRDHRPAVGGAAVAVGAGSAGVTFVRVRCSG
jgi:hypothetical protein